MKQPKQDPLPLIKKHAFHITTCPNFAANPNNKQPLPIQKQKKANYTYNFTSKYFGFVHSITRLQSFPARNPSPVSNPSLP